MTSECIVVNSSVVITLAEMNPLKYLRSASTEKDIILDATTEIYLVR